MRRGRGTGVPGVAAGLLSGRRGHDRRGRRARARRRRAGARGDAVSHRLDLEAVHRLARALVPAARRAPHGVAQPHGRPAVRVAAAAAQAPPRACSPTRTPATGLRARRARVRAARRSSGRCASGSSSRSGSRRPGTRSRLPRRAATCQEGETGHRPVPTDVYPAERRPSGGLWSTVGDLLAFAAHHLGGPGRSREARAAMREPQSQALGAGYGLGWWVRDATAAAPRSTTRARSPATSRCSCSCPEERLALAVLTNSWRGSGLVRRVVERLGLAARSGGARRRRGQAPGRGRTVRARRRGGGGRDGAATVSSSPRPRPTR